MLTLTLFMIIAPAVLAGCVSARVAKSRRVYPVRTPDNTVAGDYLDVPKGIAAGTFCAAAMWAAMITLLEACF